MEDFLEMKNYLFRLYEEAVYEYPLSDDEFSFDSDGESEDDDLDYLNRISYMHDRIIELPYDTFSDFISLFTIYFYSGSQHLTSFIDEMNEYLEKILEKCEANIEDDSEILEETDENKNVEEDSENSDENEEIDDEEKIYESIEIKSKKEFIDEIRNQVNNYLIQMLEMFYNRELYFLDNSCIESGIEEDHFFDWEILQASISDKKVENVFLKFHPNLRKELTNYKTYLENEDALKKLPHVNIKTISNFIELFVFAKEKFNDNDYLYSFLIYFLDEIREKNEVLYKSISLLLLRNYYIYEMKKEEVDMYSIGLEVQQLNDPKRYRISNEIIESFLDFDINTLGEKYEKLTKQQKKVVDDFINMDALKTFGESGKWIKINSKEQLNEYKYYLNKYGLHWTHGRDGRIDHSKNEKGYVYLSTDKNGKNTIPRLYIVVDSNNNIKTVFGKDDNCVEFDMLSILEEKIKEINATDKWLEKILNIRKVGCINDKIDKNIDLSKEEIEILYGIRSNRNTGSLKPIDPRLYFIKQKANIRKNLAIYYDCLESEVATTENELNENTIVYSKSLMLGYVTTCNYPKLKVIFGDFFASVLNNAEGLCSLERVNGNLWFESLKSSKGLEKLIWVEKDADFEEMEDASYLNKDLYVGGKFKIFGKEIEKGLVKKKETNNQVG